MVKEKANVVFLDFHRSLQYHMALQPHLKASAFAAKQAHDQNDPGVCHKLQFYPHQWEQNTHQIMTPQKWHPTGISLGPLLFNI